MPRGSLCHPGHLRNQPGATWPQGGPIACIVISIIAHHQSIGPTGRPSSAKRTWLFGKNINFILLFSQNCWPKRKRNNKLRKSNAEQSRLDWVREKIFSTNNNQSSEKCNDRYRLYRYEYVRNVNWSSKTWFTRQCLSRFQFCLSEHWGPPAVCFGLIRSVYLRPGISHISFALICIILSRLHKHSVFRCSISSALQLFVHGVLMAKPLCVRLRSFYHRMSLLWGSSPCTPVSPRVGCVVFCIIFSVVLNFHIFVLCFFLFFMKSNFCTYVWKFEFDFCHRLTWSKCYIFWFQK